MTEDNSVSPRTDLEKAGPSPRKQTNAPNVRRSIGEWENAQGESSNTAASRTLRVSPKKQTHMLAASLRTTQRTTLPSKKEVKRQGSAEVTGGSPKLMVFADRVREGRYWLEKAKDLLGDSRNLRTDIRTGIIQAIDKLYLIIKSGATEAGTGITPEQKEHKIPGQEQGTMTGTEGQELIKMMREQGEKLDKTHKELEAIRQTITSQPVSQVNTYAGVAAAQPRRHTPEGGALHSIAVASKDDSHTSDQVLGEVRKAVNAKDGWVTVERVRKAKDRKVIIGCRTAEERNKIKERLQSAEGHLIVEDMKNQDPMLVLRDVLEYNSNEDILVSLRNQNGEVFYGLDKDDDRIDVKFRRRARNPLTCNVALRVSPQIYRRIMEMGTVRIDMQKVKVADQSPLVQCSMCLSYGHSRRYCREAIPRCSHCGGPHLRVECVDYQAAAPPTCCNCTAAKAENAEHNAFSSECPVRRRWEALARAKVAYC